MCRVDVLIVAENDWANVGYAFSKCLQEVGVEAEALALNRHPFDYPDAARITSIKEMRACAKRAKIIQFMHSQYIRLGFLRRKRLFVFHGGTDYRQRYGEINKKFNSKVEKSIIQTADLLGLGARNEVWILPAVDTKKIKPVYERASDKIIIAHFPSSRKNKNTDLIVDIIERLRGDPAIRDKFVFMAQPEVVSWRDNLQRMSECDIYIEACSPKQGDRRYGEWGVTALEAAALGKIVVTHFLSLDKYEQEYGGCALEIANTGEELEHVLRRLIMLENEKLFEAKRSTRSWIEKHHSYHATGKRLMEKVYEYID